MTCPSIKQSHEMPKKCSVSVAMFLMKHPVFAKQGRALRTPFPKKIRKKMYHTFLLTDQSLPVHECAYGCWITDSGLTVRYVIKLFEQKLAKQKTALVSRMPLHCNILRVEVKACLPWIQDRGVLGRYAPGLQVCSSACVLGICSILFPMVNTSAMQSGAGTLIVI